MAKTRASLFELMCVSRMFVDCSFLVSSYGSAGRPQGLIITWQDLLQQHFPAFSRWRRLFFCSLWPRHSTMNCIETMTTLFVWGQESFRRGTQFQVALSPYNRNAWKRHAQHKHTLPPPRFKTICRNHLKFVVVVSFFFGILIGGDGCAVEVCLLSPGTFGQVRKAVSRANGEVGQGALGCCIGTWM